MIVRGVVHGLEREGVHHIVILIEIVVVEQAIHEVDLDRDQEEEPCLVVEIHVPIIDPPTIVHILDAHAPIHHRHQLCPRFVENPENRPVHLRPPHRRRRHHHRNRIVEVHHQFVLNPNRCQ